MQVSSLADESQVIGFYGQASETRGVSFKFEISVSFLDMKLVRLLLPPSLVLSSSSPSSLLPPHVWPYSYPTTRSSR